METIDDVARLIEELPFESWLEVAQRAAAMHERTVAICSDWSGSAARVYVLASGMVLVGLRHNPRNPHHRGHLAARLPIDEEWEWNAVYNEFRIRLSPAFHPEIMTRKVRECWGVLTEDRSFAAAQWRPFHVSEEFALQDGTSPRNPTARAEADRAGAHLPRAMWRVAWDRQAATRN